MRLARASGQNLLPLKSGTLGPSPSRTAIIMPVYNEGVAGVFAGVRAIYESLPGAAGFDFYILSDSTNSAHWVAEELAWQALRRELGDNIFYRHRPRNIGRKSGNIQDFCENWGAHYDYMLILDADSLMTGDTLVRLVAMMDANPRAALIQVPGATGGPFVAVRAYPAILLQSLWPDLECGPGLSATGDGNYWGHNAIIRTRAFMQHCGLPRLPGRPPFGSARS